MFIAFVVVTLKKHTRPTRALTSNFLKMLDKYALTVTSKIACWLEPGDSTCPNLQPKKSSNPNALTPVSKALHFSGLSRAPKRQAQSDY